MAVSGSRGVAHPPLRLADALKFAISLAAGKNALPRAAALLDAQVISDMLGTTPEHITVDNTLDSRISPFVGHSGSYSNKFNDVDMGAVIRATEKVRDKMLLIAAHVLKAPLAEMRFVPGGSWKRV